MTGNNPDRGLIREYLLGQLDSNEAAEMKMSEDILFDDELAEVVESVEDEIMEEYLGGKLDPPERRAVQEYFLQAPERQQRLEFLQILERSFATKQEAADSDPSRAKGEAPGFRSVQSIADHVARRRFPLWVYAQLAAAIVLGLAAAGYIAVVQRNQTVLQRELNQEEARSASLTSQVQQLQPPIVVLTLVSSRPRSAPAAGEMTPLALKTSTERIVVEIALEHPRTGAYDVRLQTPGNEKVIWSAKLLPIVSDGGDARIVFDFPARELHPGVYSVTVAEPDHGGVKYYDFNAVAPR